MSIMLKEETNSLSSIEQEITNHPAWHGYMPGLAAEKLIRGKQTPYLYLLRAGEHEMDYYVTYVLPDLSIQHRPFVISITAEGWHYSNGGFGGPFTTASIDDVLHLIMHCNKGANTPKVLES